MVERILIALLQKKDNSTPHLATEYDKQIQRTVPYYNKFHEETINFITTYNPQPKVWLDTGCGTGLFTEKCVHQFPDTTFILSDPSKEMMQVAKEKLSKNKGVLFLEPTATEDISVEILDHADVITAIQAHHYLSASDRNKATKVCFNSLNSDGVFITFENVSPMTQRGIEIGKRNWGNYQLSMGKTEEQVENHLARFGNEYFPITIEAHLELYRSCGFKIVELLWYSYMQAGFFCIK